MKQFILIVLLVFSLTGCSVLKEYSDAVNSRIKGRSNVAQSFRVRENLVGLTAQEIKNKYGNPDDYSVSYGQNATYESLTYWGSGRHLSIALTNGIVSNVRYNDY